MSHDDDISADKLARAIERLEQERAKRAGPAPEAPLIVERTTVDPATNAIIAHQEAIPVRRAEPRPRRAKKPRAEDRATPQYFHIMTAKPVAGDPGCIEEGWFVVQGGKVFLCDAGGYVTGEGRKIEPRGELFTARMMLRDKLAAKRPGPDHRPLVYPKLVY